MKATYLSAAAVLLAGAVACAAASPSANLSHAEVKAMIRDAHTSQQFQALADYFRSRQQYLEQQAAAEKAEWERLSQNVSSRPQKYPRPVDASRNRYEYFTSEASQMRQKADHYASLAANPQPASTR